MTNYNFENVSNTKNENEFLKAIVINKDQNDSAVDHPDHYTQGGIECIKAIEASMTPEEFQGSCKANVFKYLWRWRNKNGLEDLKKARVYLNWLIESVEKQLNNKKKNES